MKTDHTPGPWYYDGDGFDNEAAKDCGTEGYAIFSKDDDGVPKDNICEVSDQLDDTESEANAALIAAAPDLLAALEYAYNSPPGAIASEKMLAAIKKAKGEQP